MQDRITLFRRVLPQRAGRRRLCHRGRSGADRSSTSRTCTSPRRTSPICAGGGIFSEEFLDYLRDFRFTGDIWAVPEGTPIFPREPIITVRAPAIQAQLIETYLLLAHQPPEPDRHEGQPRRAARRRAARCSSSARAGRRAPTGAILGARAAYIGGCAGTACTISDQLYGVPAGGTMAHSWVQMFDTRVRRLPRLLRDLSRQRRRCWWTPTTRCKSGVPNAIRAFNEVLQPARASPSAASGSTPAT